VEFGGNRAAGKQGCDLPRTMRWQRYSQPAFFISTTPYSRGPPAKSKKVYLSSPRVFDRSAISAAPHAGQGPALIVLIAGADQPPKRLSTHNPPAQTAMRQRPSLSIAGWNRTTPQTRAAFVRSFSVRRGRDRGQLGINRTIALA
jgi:hypothetical protein